MKMIELLEKDREQLLSELTTAHTADKAIRVLEKEADKLLLRYNEASSSDRAREASAGLIQAVRLALSLIDSTGKTKVWERGEAPDESKGFSWLAFILVIAAIALLGFGLVPLVLGSFELLQTWSYTDMISRSVAILGTIVLSYFAGKIAAKPKKTKVTRDQQVEIHIDPDKVYRNFRVVILSVDQSLEEIQAAERFEKREMAGTIDGRPATTPELDLFSNLIAASYSGDPEYALEKLEEIRYYLHKQQIEVVDYSESTKQYFDLMPGMTEATIRPALVANGGLLKKGLASTGR